MANSVNIHRAKGQWSKGVRRIVTVAPSYISTLQVRSLFLSSQGTTGGCIDESYDSLLAVLHLGG